MKALWLDVQVAAAGDMLLAALLDAGADAEAVEAGLRSLGLGDWTWQRETVHRASLIAHRLTFSVHGQPLDGPAHDHDHTHDHNGHHPHRPWRDVRDRIANAPLAPRVRDRALAAYRRLAEVEAALHAMPVDDVELHEVGATDAILDIVGSALALESLGIDRIVASTMPLATGSVRAAHGELSLPAPATLALLKGWPTQPCVRPGEWVTPTGAAIVTSWALPGAPPAGTPVRIGHGAGKRDPAGVANLVRAVVLEIADDDVTDDVVELATHLDDMTGQTAADAISGLLAAGALDAWATPLTMKKGRPGIGLHALVKPKDASRLSIWLLRNTPTLGVRRHPWQRDVLDRWFEPAATAYGTVKMKVGGRDGEAWHATPEHDDVVRAAEAAGVPTLLVMQAATAAFLAQNSKGSR